MFEGRENALLPLGSEWHSASLDVSRRIGDTSGDGLLAWQSAATSRRLWRASASRATSWTESGVVRWIECRASGFSATFVAYTSGDEPSASRV